MYDVLIIGNGPGGYASALKVAELGGKAALIEASKPGGTCVNVGCIPSKVWMQAADFINSTQAIKAFGIDAEIKGIDLKAIIERKNSVVNNIQTGIGEVLSSRGVEMINGRAHLKNASTIDVDGKRLEGRSIIIATGSSPDVPNVEGLEEALITTDKLFDMTEIPKSVLILGAEYIEVEAASLLNSLGCKVVMATKDSRILCREDQETGQRIKLSLTRRGIEILTRRRLGSVEKKGSFFDCRLSETDEQIIQADKVLVCSRKPNTAGLGLSEIGVRLREDGSILANDHLESSVKGIYAVGDVAGEWMMSHEASSMGETAAKNAMGQNVVYPRRLVPRGLWSTPEMGCVGLSEEEAEKQGYDIEVGTFPYALNGYAMCQNEPDGAVKIISDNQYDEILGVHIVGKHAVDMVGEAVLAMQLECTAKEWAKGIRLHPTFSEIIIQAAKNIES